ncbi:uncharacterized protein JCM15063_000613 [Sporobolomyces koalae]|uniref:uncharacterized protein n=1 Tax=Sporobolomyces koalae TaxID=500713 RepID=UPI003170513D
MPVPTNTTADSTSAPVRLDTFRYHPVPGGSDLEQGLGSGAARSEQLRNERETFKDGQEEEGLEEDVWDDSDPTVNVSTKPPRRWIRQVALFVLGAVVGAVILSSVHSLWSTSAPQVPEFLLGGPHASSVSVDFDFEREPPVRIHYLEEPTMNDRAALLGTCPIPVVFTSDESAADIVVYNSDSNRGLNEDELKDRRRDRPWQKQVIWGVESAPNREFLEAHFDKLQQGRRNETYHYEMTYRLNSTVPTTYSYGYFNYSNPPVPYASKRHDKIAASFVSNCRPKNARTLILDELTTLLGDKLDNFGKCHNNANADDTLKQIGHYEDVGTSHTNWNTKITTINYYLFTIAFENSNDFDYVTEKYFQALERGSVPIVFGAPSYSTRFFPALNAAIDVADYLPTNYTQPSRTDSKEPTELSQRAKDGIAQLANRLKYLSSEEGRDEYELMLEWKKMNWWKANPRNPLSEIVRMAHSPWEQDCKLAGIFRGNQSWAQSGYSID